jgi:hypothetical protein
MCTVPGCSRRHHARGHCLPHYIDVHVHGRELVPCEACGVTFARAPDSDVTMHMWCQIAEACPELVGAGAIKKSIARPRLS